MCEGCWTYNIVKKPRCKHIPMKDNKQCPCSICLVKTMCNKVCEEFAIYTDIPKQFWDIIEEIYVK